MKTDLTFEQRYPFVSTVFNPDFDNGAPINANQAWSLFFTFGQNDAILDASPELGRFFNNLLLAVIVTGIIGASIFTSI